MNYPRIPIEICDGTSELENKITMSVIDGKYYGLKNNQIVKVKHYKKDILLDVKIKLKDSFKLNLILDKDFCDKFGMSSNDWFKLIK